AELSWLFSVTELKVLIYPLFASALLFPNKPGSGADIHAIGDIGLSDVSLPENLLQLSMTAKDDVLRIGESA
ncbi:hypothetical protein, partial [Lonsdalea populi]|uniref:hypothetical protein n=1 Tax=Lonsdalea populi TaxID=1172565 RepID=UPI001C655107